MQAGELQWDGSTKLDPPVVGAVPLRVFLAGCTVSLLWGDGTLQVSRLLPHQAPGLPWFHFFLRLCVGCPCRNLYAFSLAGELDLKPHFIRKLSGFMPQPIIRAKQNGKTLGVNGKRKSGTVAAVHQPPSTLVYLRHHQAFLDQGSDPEHCYKRTRNERILPSQVAVVGCPSDATPGQELHMTVVDTLYGTLRGRAHQSTAKLLAAVRAGAQQQLEAVHLEEASLLAVLLQGALLLCPLQV